jgi:hypothetical protein
MPGNGRRPAQRPDTVALLYSQADRARKMAGECGSALVADLFELHAQLCERNAKMLLLEEGNLFEGKLPYWVTSKRPVIVAVRDGPF